MRARSQTVKCAVLQDVLSYFRRNRLMEWTCTISREMCIQPIEINHFDKIITLCQWHLTTMNYERVSLKVMGELGKTFDPYGYNDSDGDSDSEPDLDTFLSSKISYVSISPSTYGYTSID